MAARDPDKSYEEAQIGKREKGAGGRKEKIAINS